MNPSSILPSASVAAAPPSVWRTVAGFPRPVWFLFLGTFINRFGTFVVPFLAIHITRLGYSAAQSGLALGAFGLGHLLASAVGGHLADAFGRRRTIIGAMVAGAGCMLWLSQAQSLAGLIGLAFLTGLTGEFYRPASAALLTDLIPESQRVTAFAAYRFSINAGWAFGPAVAGFLAEHSYFWLFVGDAATSLLYGLIAFRYLPRDEGQGRRSWRRLAELGPSLAESVRAATRDPRFAQLVVATFAVALVFLQMPSTLGLEIKAAGLSDQVYGFVLALNGVLIVLFEIPLSAFTQRRAARPVMAAGFVLIGLGAAVNAWAESPSGYAFGMVVFTAGEMLSMPVALAYVAGLAPADMRGRYLGLYGLTWAGAFAAGPSLGALVFTWQPLVLWLGCGVIGLVAGLVIARGPARNGRREGGRGKR